MSGGQVFQSEYDFRFFPDGKQIEIRLIGFCSQPDLFFSSRRIQPFKFQIIQIDSATAGRLLFRITAGEKNRANATGELPSIKQLHFSMAIGKFHPEKINSSIK